MLLYVDPDCPYCRAEVAAWAAMASRSGEAPTPTVIVSETSSAAALTRLPGLGALSWYRDPDGSVARALGVTAVPFTAVTDGDGTVVSVRMGRLSADERGRTLTLLDPTHPRRTP